MEMTEPDMTAALPAEVLLDFVTAHFRKRDHYLEMVAKNASPLYLLDRGALLEKAGAFRGTFSNVFPDVGFYYAVKSNNHPEISRILLESGFGLDVSSGLELQAALSLGATDIVFSGPGKTAEELDLAAMHNDRVTVLMDSFGELERLSHAAKSRGRVVRAGIRLTSNPQGLWRKFGILPEKLDDFFAAAESHKFVQLEGLQFHTSWNLTPEAQVAFIRKLGGILAGMDRSRRAKIGFIDIGGGYWPPAGEWLQPTATPEGMRRAAFGKPVMDPMHHFFQAAEPIDVFSLHLGQAVNEHVFPHVQCRICFEPGRWVCHDAMHLVMTVIDKKAPDLVITDAGTNAVGWERFESDYFPLLNLTRPSLSETPCHVLGSLCTPHDVWSYSFWGNGIEEGDLVMIPTQGAYTYSLRQNFIKPVPQVVTLLQH